jgi:hypothetical protein
MGLQAYLRRLDLTERPAEERGGDELALDQAKARNLGSMKHNVVRKENVSRERRDSKKKH